MLKQKFFLAVLTLAMTGAVVANAQEAKPDSTKTAGAQELKEDERIYARALRYNDVTVAKNALFRLIEKYPQDLRYIEALASLYYEYEQYSSSALVALDLLKIDDDNIAALEIAAVSLENIGAIERSVSYYESLYLLTNDLFTLYKAAYLQYGLKRFTEADNSIKMLLSARKIDEVKLNFPKKDNTQQEVPLRAAVLNLKGLMALEQNNKAEALVQFNEALKILPDFELAQENIKTANAK